MRKDKCGLGYLFIEMGRIFLEYENGNRGKARRSFNMLALNSRKDKLKSSLVMQFRQLIR